MTRLATPRTSASNSTGSTSRKTSPKSIVKAKRSLSEPLRTPDPLLESPTPADSVVVASEPEPWTAEAEFRDAMLAYKKSSGRMFPTWSEVLEVLQKLGYRKLTWEERAGAEVAEKG